MVVATALSALMVNAAAAQDWRTICPTSLAAGERVARAYPVVQDSNEDGERVVRSRPQRLNLYGGVVREVVWGDTVYEKQLIYFLDYSPAVGSAFGAANGLACDLTRGDCEVRLPSGAGELVAVTLQSEMEFDAAIVCRYAGEAAPDVGDW